MSTMEWLHTWLISYIHTHKSHHNRNDDGDDEAPQTGHGGADRHGRQIL